MNSIPSTRGGAGRGQGRKPISEDGSKAYKLLLTDEQRAKLDQLGNAAWIREQIDFAHHLETVNMSTAVNTSARFIDALRELPQFICVIPPNGALTDVRTGMRVTPLGDLTDSEDDTDLLQLTYAGGHSVTVIAHLFLKLAIKDAAEIELACAPGEFGIKESKYTPAQARAQFLLEHLERTHRLL